MERNNSERFNNSSFYARVSSLCHRNSYLWLHSVANQLEYNMRITRRQLRSIIKEVSGVPSWPEKHFAWRSAVFTRDGDVRYINDVASPETIQASMDIGNPVTPGSNVLIVKGAYPNSQSVWLHDSEALGLIEREGWHERPPPKGAKSGFWDGKGEWSEDPEEWSDSLPSVPTSLEEKTVRGKGKDKSILFREEANPGVLMRDVDDILDDAIRDAAPEIVRDIREREVDEDIDEFIDGALHGSWDAKNSSYPDPPEVGSPTEVMDAGDNEEVTAMYRLGYEWGWDNLTKIQADQPPPAAIRAEMIEYALENFKSRVTEEFVIDTLEKATGYVKKQMGDVHDLLKKAKEKFGWKIAPAIVGIEVFEHAILPTALGAIHPIFYGLAAVPTIEILAASALAIAKARMPSSAPAEIPPGHLDWYETEYGQVTNELIIRKYVRELLEAQSGGPGVQQSIGYGKNYHTVNPQPITWKNYEGLSYSISAEGDGSYYASIEIKDYPELSIPTKSFPDENSAEWWVRDNYEKLHRILMAKSSAQAGL